MWTDNEANEDFLNFTGVAGTVSELIIQAQGRPVSIGVSGAWGVGKSSMIKLIHKELEKRDAEEKKKYIYVQFNAWLYQGYDDARAALMDVIASKLLEEAETRKTGVDKAKEFLKRVNWVRTAKIGISAAGMFAGIPPVALIGEAVEWGKELGSGNFDAEKLKQAEEALEKVGKAAKKALNAKETSSPPKQIHELRDCFEATLKEMDVTLVVLIDDLDRCLPETTISTLEAIRLFLFLDNTAFVIAADNEMIKHAVRRHFEGMEDDNLVTSYFDKLIQIPIRVPALGTQEVRAYMLLLFVENSELTPEEKEHIRTKVCEQLSQSWQGKRVDRAFIQSIHATISADLLARLDMADRLAPIMTKASGIKGNPRLIKRFLNALAIRMTISQAHGVGVDETALVKMLLFERSGNPEAYQALTKSVMEDASGKPSILADWEDKLQKGKRLELSGPWKDEFMLEWLALPPKLASLDLRGILYVSREHAPLIFAEDQLSSEGAELMSALFATPDMASSLKGRIDGLPRNEIQVIMDKALEQARQEQEWGVPSILEVCLMLAEVDPSQGDRLAAFLSGRPPAQIKPSIVPKISGQSWTAEVYAKWASTNVSQPVKNAIKAQDKK